MQTEPPRLKSLTLTALIKIQTKIALQFLADLKGFASAGFSSQVWMQGDMDTGFADLKDLVAKVWGKDVCQEMEDEDFRRLKDEKYTSKLLLEHATAESLIATGLNRAIVDVIVSRTSGAAFHLPDKQDVDLDILGHLLEGGCLIHLSIILQGTDPHGHCMHCHVGIRHLQTISIACCWTSSPSRVLCCALLVAASYAAIMMQQ